ncbi:MAG: PfkB family carbohydrate kinase, partial [Puniceicoccales bacterium]|nr:PfkB family carbohydrate kinase [Puniceicoccales bacterium]
YAREVFDVSGAGDTSIACLTVALAAGAPLIQAAKFANIAAGIVVAKHGTAAISSGELLNSENRQLLSV